MSHGKVIHARPSWVRGYNIETDSQGKADRGSNHETVVICCRPIVWVPRQLVTYMATFGTEVFQLKVLSSSFIYVVSYAENI